MSRDTTERDWDERRTGGAGAARQPLSNGDYRRQMRKLERMAAADSED